MLHTCWFCCTYLGVRHAHTLAGIMMSALCGSWYMQCHTAGMLWLMCGSSMRAAAQQVNQQTDKDIRTDYSHMEGAHQTCTASCHLAMLSCSAVTLTSCSLSYACCEVATKLCADGAGPRSCCNSSIKWQDNGTDAAEVGSAAWHLCHPQEQQPQTQPGKGQC